MDVDKEFAAMTETYEDETLLSFTVAWPGGSRTIRYTRSDMRGLTWYMIGVIVGLRLARKD